MFVYLHMYLHTDANMHTCILTLRETEAGRLQLPRVFCNFNGLSLKACLINEFTDLLKCSLFSNLKK